MALDAIVNHIIPGRADDLAVSIANAGHHASTIYLACLQHCRCAVAWQVGLYGVLCLLSKLTDFIDGCRTSGHPPKQNSMPLLFLRCH